MRVVNDIFDTTIVKSSQYYKRWILIVAEADITGVSSTGAGDGESRGSIGVR